MEQDNSTRPLWEFEILAFLKDEFPNVGLAMPNLMGQPKIWNMIYLITAGINAVAKVHDDLIDLRLDVTSDLNMEFKCFTLRGKHIDEYMKIVRLVAGQDTKGYFEFISNYCPLDLQPDHMANLSNIEEIIKQGQHIQMTTVADLPAVRNPGAFVIKASKKSDHTDEYVIGRLW